MKWTLNQLIAHANSCLAEIRPGVWVPSRPMPMTGIAGFAGRVNAAWLVLIGCADAVVWPENDEEYKAMVNAKERWLSRTQRIQ